MYFTIPVTVCSHPHCCGSTQYSLDHLPNVTTQQPNAKGGPGGSNEWEVPRSVIDIGAEVGQGSYGVVFKGQLKLTARSLKIYAHRQEMEFEGKSYRTVAVKMLRSK